MTPFDEEDDDNKRALREAASGKAKKRRRRLTNEGTSLSMSMIDNDVYDRQSEHTPEHQVIVHVRMYFLVQSSAAGLNKYSPVPRN